MNVKKIAALIAASMTICFSSLNFVYAEEASESETSQEEPELILSEDSMWKYVHVTDEDTNEEYVSLESYLGHEKEVVIPEEIDGNVILGLGEYTFRENEAIEKVTISENLKYFGGFPFFACTSIKEFEVNDKNEIYEAVDGVVYGDDKQLLIVYPPAKSDTEYTVPDGVVAIHSGAFACCSNLKKVNFPDSLQKFGAFCFSECTSLNNIVIPEKVTELSEFNFTGCTALTDITLPEKLSVIGAGAFFSCKVLNSIEFPSSLSEIGEAAFVSTGFKEIEIPPGITTIGYSAFGYDTDQTGQLITMESFTIKGATSSQAQWYCADEGNNHITFVPIDEKYAQEATSENSDSDKNSGVNPGMIVGIVIVFLVAIIVPLFAVFKSKSKNSSKKNGNKKAQDKEE